MELQQARANLRFLQRRRASSVGTLSDQEVSAAQALVTSCDSALSETQQSMQAAFVPKTLPEIAYYVLKTKSIDLLDGFRSMDTDSDGVLSPAELQSGFAALTSIKLNSAQVQALVAELEGPNGDGMISYLEFHSFFTNMAEREEEERHLKRLYSLCKNGVWLPWDSLSTDDQKSCLHLGYDPCGT